MKQININTYSIVLLFIACGIIIFYAIYKYTQKDNKKDSKKDSKNGNIKDIEESNKILIIKNDNKKEKKVTENEDNELIIPTPDKYELNYGEETRGISRIVNKPLSSIVPNNILTGNTSFIPDYSNFSL